MNQVKLKIMEEAIQMMQHDCLEHVVEYMFSATLEALGGDVKKADNIKLCPFCGVKMEMFGDGLDYSVSPPITKKQVIHPENGCCLSILVFSVKKWNTRV